MTCGRDQQVGMIRAVPRGTVIRAVRRRGCLAAALAAGVALAACGGSGSASVRDARVARPASAIRAAVAKNRPVAVIYRIPGKPYFRVHNALETASAKRGVQIAHVGRWPDNAPEVKQFWVCRKSAQHSPLCGPTKQEKWVLYAVRPYPASYAKHGVKYKTGPAIAFKAGSMLPHDGGYACFTPAGKTGCTYPAWPGDNKILQRSGTLVYLHFVNLHPPKHAPKPGGRYATSISDFTFEAGHIGGGKPGHAKISAQRICYLIKSC